MFAHLVKKLLFMGSEFGQLREWTETQEQDWSILHYPIHDAFHHYMVELNHLYLNEPALYAQDYEDGFRWIDCHQEPRCIYAIERRFDDNRLLILLHLSDEVTAQYTFSVPNCKSLVPLLHTEWERFSGTVPENHERLRGDFTRDGMQFTLDLPPFSGICLKIES